MLQAIFRYKAAFVDYKLYLMQNILNVRTVYYIRYNNNKKMYFILFFFTLQAVRNVDLCHFKNEK